MILQTGNMYLAADVLLTVEVGAVTEGRRYGRKNNLQRDIEYRLCQRFTEGNFA